MRRASLDRGAAAIERAFNALLLIAFVVGTAVAWVSVRNWEADRAARLGEIGGAP